jgi:hypothetical protein
MCELECLEHKIKSRAIVNMAVSSEFQIQAQLNFLLCN